MTSLLANTGLAALVTIKRDGRPQLSNIGYAYDPASGVARISLTDTRAKTRNLRRDPRASLYLTTPNLRAYEVVEGTVELTPVTVRRTTRQLTNWSTCTARSPVSTRTGTSSERR
jgi:PPOX class probable F420-dependent enzyme